MRHVTKSRVLSVIGLAAALLTSGWGAGTSGAEVVSRSAGSEAVSAAAAASPASPAVTGSASATESAAAVPTPTGTKKTIRYGPFNLPGAPMNPDGTHGHYHTGNLFQFGAAKPCTDCYITGMVADLVYADGTQANWSNDAQLHHMVLFNSSFGRSDATCSASVLGFLGQRFFASGDERTPVISPPGYGYYSGWFDNWTMIYELANHRDTAKTVYIEMDYWYVPALFGTAPGMTNVEPVWMDIDQCGDSEYTTPQGPSSRTWTWNVNRPGRIIGAGGHLHDGGINLEIRNDSTNTRICDSRAGYGESPAYIGHHGEEHISSMSVCYGENGAPVATVSNGQRVTIRANYDQPAAVDNAMGIALMYIAP